MNEVLERISEMTSGWQLEVDPVAAGIAVVAVIISLLARRDSRRSVELAERLARERGKLKKLEVRDVAVGGPILRDGRVVGQRMPHPTEDMSTGALRVTAYSGSDDLTIAEVEMIVQYTTGLLSPKNYYVYVPLNSSASTVNVRGPRLPHRLAAHDQAKWELPHLSLAYPMKQTESFSSLPGTLLLGPWDALRISARVQATAWRSNATVDFVAGSRWVLKMARSRFARHYPIGPISELVSAPEAPEHLKNLLRLWISRPSSGEGAVSTKRPSAPPAQGGLRTGRSKRAKSHRRGQR